MVLTVQEQPLACLDEELMDEFDLVQHLNRKIKLDVKMALKVVY